MHDAFGWKLEESLGCGKRRIHFEDDLNLEKADKHWRRKPTYEEIERTDRVQRPVVQ